ncbi:hypothetical protein, partial [Rothia nasimurium]|uniref:hypothetical protein n=1 Tax=Rothia nasimurium TaxID=85336 RepID=UPI00366D91A2
MITLALTLICGISIALTLARDRLTQSKKHPRLGKAITRAQPALIGVLLAAVIALGWSVIATSPALILYLAMPLVGWLFYGFKEWRLRNPGRLSYILAGTLSGALGTLAGRRRRRKPYTMSESQRQRVKKLPEKPRSYWGVIFPSWVSLVLHTDKPIWCILSQVTVLLGALT